MNFLKKLKNMDRQVLILIAVCVLILLVVLFYPRKQQTGVKLVPVKGTSYYQAVFEGMENQNKGQIVFFGTEWCPHCTTFKKVWSKFKKNHPNVKCVYVDCDKQKNLAKKHNIKGFPTIKYLPNGLNDPTGSQIMNAANNYSSLVEFSADFL